MAAGIITSAVKLIDETGAPYGIAKAGNKIRTSSMPYSWDVVIGNIPSHDEIVIFGINSDVDDVREDVWEPGGTYVFPPSGGIQMSIVSSSLSDAPSGTGARTIELDVLLADYSEATIVMTMEGTSPVLTTETNILRVNGMHVITTGSNLLGVGNISLTSVGGGITYSYIQAGLNVSRQAIYTVPLGKTLYLVAWNISVGNTAGGRYGEFMLRTTANKHGVLVPMGVFNIRDMGSAQDGGRNIPLEFPLKVPATADVKISVISDAGTSNAICIAGFKGWLE